MKRNVRVAIMNKIRPQSIIENLQNHIFKREKSRDLFCAVVTGRGVLLLLIIDLVMTGFHKVGQANVTFVSKTRWNRN